MDSVLTFVDSTPQGPHKLATILSEEAKQLLAMDRYERRALFRRKTAIQAFDEARRASGWSCAHRMIAIATRRGKPITDSRNRDQST
jgi:hypothetical protein